ncbi:hypothetical protein SAMN05216246_10539 [Actinomyces denticolens]|uniref:Uncharacterized protein n=1 Tax=Actinomyces denticolens TaxID=52767 RepID=A0ABY1I965_9ACTO|nr:hypothetical protein [Actinomyces denticolens]SHI79718.1 hypothetical protein SAMN05216246_10539 [Actinomyces denticolens]
MFIENDENDDDADVEQPVHPHREFPNLADCKSKFTTTKGIIATGIFIKSITA